MIDRIKYGDYVKLHYLMRLEDGSIFFDTFGKGPVVVKIGDDTILKGVDNALIGMGIDEFKSIRINASEIFGVYDPRKVFVISRNDLPKNIDIKVGMILHKDDNDGKKVFYRVVNIHNDMVMLDANHPLAGHDIEVEVEVTVLSISNDINELYDENRFNWFKEKISSLNGFEEVFNNYVYRNNKKILICISAFNRKKITKLCLEQINRYKTENCWLQVFNDHSTEYDSSFLKYYADEVIKLPHKMGIHHLRLYQLERFLETEFDFLYMTDNDVIHDPEFIKALSFLYDLGNGELPVCIYNSRFHMFSEILLFHQNGIFLKRTAPGVSMFFDKKMVERIVRMINKSRGFHKYLSWDYRIIAYLDKPFITSETSFLEHFGADGIHNTDFDRDCALNPTIYLKQRREPIIRYLTEDIPISINM